MSTALYSSGRVPSGPNRWLWAAVGALGATTVALGVALVQMRPAPIATPVVASSVVAAPVPAVSAPGAPADVRSIPAVAPVKTAHAATKKIAIQNPVPPAPMDSATTTPPPPVTAQLPPPPPRAVCAQCGTVEAVTPVVRDGAGSGAGAVAGAVLGGLLGNQVGGGSGKTLATVVGAMGGGWAGNTVEKRMKKETVYQVDVRMEDGSSQRVMHASPVSVGAHVTVNAGVLSQ